jgi:DNA modification methylase
MNRLLFGDNLVWLRNRSVLPDESVDLVYLDPPFNSNATYNVLFKEESGEASRAQFHAFTDTWHWADAEPAYREFIATCTLGDAVEVMEAFHDFLKTSQMMAYLAMMAPRLVELHRVLKPTGSIYLHCDPTASRPRSRGVARARTAMPSGGAPSPTSCSTTRNPAQRSGTRSTCRTARNTWRRSTDTANQTGGCTGSTI